jgi:hypothetical protein
MATYQFGLTERAQTAYNALNIPFTPQLDFADLPQVGAFIMFGNQPTPQWFTVIAKEYAFVAPGDTRVYYVLDTYTPSAGAAAGAIG